MVPLSVAPEGKVCGMLSSYGVTVEVQPEPVGGVQVAGNLLPPLGVMKASLAIHLADPSA